MKFVLSAMATAALAASAHAGFTGFTTEIQDIGGGQFVSRVFATYSQSNDTLLNVFGIAYVGGFNTTDMGPGNFVHNDLAGGSWSPQFALANDSFVTIGGNPGFTNSTAADPNWGVSGFQQTGLVTNAGWFNQNPPNLQGQAGAGLKTLIMQVVHSADQRWDIFAKVGYNQGLGTPTVFGEGILSIGNAVPAPGALALLGLAGLAGRRRRA